MKKYGRTLPVPPNKVLGRDQVGSKAAITRRNKNRGITLPKLNFTKTVEETTEAQSQRSL